MSELISWEQAVSWLRDQEDQEFLVRACYYDDPLLQSAVRFYESQEWKAVCDWLPNERGTVLDIGAGRGISSYAFARDGWDVTALEPDSSDLVGAWAIRCLANQSGIDFTVAEEWV